MSALFSAKKGFKIYRVSALGCTKKISTFSDFAISWPKSAYW